MIKLSNIFSDNMVLTKNAKIWGKSAPNEKIIIKLSSKKTLIKQTETVADKYGNFETTLSVENYGGAYFLKINEVTIKNVYIGKVWLCSGQSNMEQPLSRAFSLLHEFIKEDRRIVAFQAVSGCAFEPAENTESAWKSATGDFLQEVFAVPYFFARKLLKADSKIHVGLINVAAGGSPVEAWMPEEVIKTFPDLYEKMLPYKNAAHIKWEETDDNSKSETWHKQLSQTDLGLQEDWTDFNYNDSDWEVRSLLDCANLPKHGSVWYRKEIFLNQPFGSQIKLNLGRVVDSVAVYVNGEEVTRVLYQYPPCVCTIPQGLLQAGKNIIAIRVVADANNPSFTPGKKYQLQIGETTINLQNNWKCRVGAIMPKLEPARRLYNIPCSTYNFMLAPVLGYSVDGMLWYQGESNTGQPAIYEKLFTAFAEHIREKLGNIPIITTQLANFVDPVPESAENWAILREQQRQCLKIANTAMAVAIDCGEWNDLHPQDKKTVGERLAACAENLAYSKNVPFSGPTVESATISDNCLIIKFSNAKGLYANGRPTLDLLHESGRISTVYANVVENTLVATFRRVPKKVRFGWTDCPNVVLYNAHDLPASPFEVDVT